jgi:hypothetical protein
MSSNDQPIPEKVGFCAHKKFKCTPEIFLRTTALKHFPVFTVKLCHFIEILTVKTAKLIIKNKK